MTRFVFKLFPLCLLLVPVVSFGQEKFSAEEYTRALWMTTRFYGAQRSGNGPNWLIMEHDTAEYRTSFTSDADGSTDLEGGWFDCGDHVTFGNTFFFSAYVLAKAYELFPTGYHDKYCGFDYADYSGTGNWDMDGGKGDGIPDLLQEIKYATDWIIKATPDGSTFYYQKGEGAKDHQLWVTSGKMSSLSVDSGGEPRKIYKNPNDGVMAALAAGALAIMSRVYDKYDNEYAETCLEHAKNAYQYAKSHKGQAAGAGDGGFYSAHASPAEVAFITGASEMYASTGEDGYKNDALAEKDKIKFHNWGFDYSNTHDLAPLAMVTCGVDSTMIDVLKATFVDAYINSLNDEGVCTKGNSSWGALRYPGNHAFIVAAWSKVTQDTSLESFIYKQVDYIMGGNNAKQSFIVGFCADCEKSPQFPHHRNVYLRDDNPPDSAKATMTIPERNALFGYLVGGTWKSGDFHESVTDYAMTEGGIDYNAGLVASLGYIVSRIDPADTAQQVGVTHPVIRTASTLLHKNAVRKTAAGWQVRFTEGQRITRVSVIDTKGRVCFSMRPEARSFIIPAHALAGGVYSVVFYRSSGMAGTVRIVGVAR